VYFLLRVFMMNRNKYFMKRNFTIKETAKLLGVCDKTIFRMVADGQIIAFKCRDCLRITEESLDVYRVKQILKYQEENGIWPD
jgi:excisionase family DNA binding protein